MKNLPKNILMLAAFASAILLTGCAGPKIYSNWTDQQITVDGKAKDWRLGDDAARGEGFVFAARNDDKNLYLAVSAEEKHWFLAKDCARGTSASRALAAASLAYMRGSYAEGVAQCEAALAAPHTPIEAREANDLLARLRRKLDLLPSL